MEIISWKLHLTVRNSVSDCLSPPPPHLRPQYHRPRDISSKGGQEKYPLRLVENSQDEKQQGKEIPLDDELDLDEKMTFVRKVRTDAAFSNETLALLDQEKLIRSDVVEYMPFIHIKPAWDWKKSLSF